jgi:small-conductance mechanosensitive channel
VWYPDRDILNELKLVNLKISNLSSYVDLEILKLKHEDLQELKCLQNRTHQLELELIKSKLREFKGKSAEDEIKQYQELRMHVNNLTQRLIQLENRMSKRANRKSRLKQERALEDSGHVTINTLRTSVSDLKSEWIMIKRDIFDLHKDIAYLKRDHNDVTNLTQHLQGTTETLKKTVDNFKSSLDHSSQTVRILNSNFDTLKQIVSIKDENELRSELNRMSVKISDIEGKIDAFELNTSSLEKAVEKIVSTRSTQNSSGIHNKTPGTNYTFPTGNMDDTDF